MTYLGRIGAVLVVLGVVEPACRHDDKCDGVSQRTNYVTPGGSEPNVAIGCKWLEFPEVPVDLNVATTLPMDQCHRFCDVPAIDGGLDQMIYTTIACGLPACAQYDPNTGLPEAVICTWRITGGACAL